MTEELIAAAEAIRADHYPTSDVVFLAGSIVRGEGTASSDLDLVVVFERLPAAYRESFRFGRWPVETFVHDPATLEYFFDVADAPRGVPSLATMVAEGIEVPAPTELSRSLKNLAAAKLAAGPPLWGRDELDRSRYMITMLADDLLDPRSPAESTATGVALYEALATHFFRSRGLWSANSKAIPKKLAEVDPAFADAFVAAFDALFAMRQTEPVQQLAEKALAPDGGRLFEGHTATAPKEWRKG